MKKIIHALIHTTDQNHERYILQIRTTLRILDAIIFMYTHTYMMMHTSEHRARGRRMKRLSDGALARWRESIHNHVRNEEHHSKDKKHIMKQKNLRL